MLLSVFVCVAISATDDVTVISYVTRGSSRQLVTCSQVIRLLPVSLPSAAICIRILV